MQPTKESNWFMRWFNNLPWCWFGFHNWSWEFKEGDTLIMDVEIPDDAVCSKCGQRYGD